MQRSLIGPRRHAMAWPGLLSALLLAALSLLTAPSAHAATTICDKFGSTHVSGDTYVVQNDEWGDTIQQCINATDDGFQYTTGYHNLSGGAPAAYPSIYVGCHYGNCSTGSGLPLQVSAFANPTSSVDFTTADGQWDAAYDIWFDSTPNPTGQNDGAELMIWANHAGPPQPFGAKVGTVGFEGAVWDVWYGRQGTSPAWNTVSYVRQQSANAVTVNIRDFTDDMAARGYLSTAWYMTSVQFGFEPWVGGPGLGVNSFSYDPHGTGTGGTGGAGLLSQGHDAWASSSETTDYPASNAVDGNASTRWSSCFCDGQWLNVDLGASHRLSNITLNWEAAYASAFKLQVSDDPAFGTWSDLTTVTNGTGGSVSYSVSGTGRYVRLLEQQRATPYGTSLYELQVYGT
ncbi:GH12 family glycosyl hydrolase domain-containing protein [Actinacidiphila sp. ITFR-21]|uniref:GH12 family glycosyl hydrolase domain-containing protein n=1 Tax=Actinacidiphila sp. ITFR-21 TaxID=3075199 RepID=UPI00288C0513|nr:discoidin domain-containing protein [Streptomyces sp. ITFR-21]WNI16841.1 discoidin domain-containing protein [Streptomyces sp. ITFR-21]